ncbi:winged helix-turn-helix domain-containing protein [Thermomonas fusca]|uniref:winged helix-turn-helix domain-containing protein n=1 Tax=Thermomonas fusca TaxID=215690 RepID=UPI001486BB5C|nr:winged helix-turn-helix domain-containing protein [Thermomonas fusca]
MDLPAPDNLVFDDVVIDFAGRRLLRAGMAQALEPKAFAVLALLGSAPGHVFTRDEILDVVWGHRHVTPGVLNRVMTMLRKALGEDAQSPRYLHTVHGVGYRFDLPAAAGPPLAAVVAPEPVSVSVPASLPAPASPAPVPAGQHLRRRAGDALPAVRPIPTPLPRRRASDWRRSRRPGWLAWIALLLAAAGAAGWALWPRLPPPPAPGPVAPAIDARSIAVLPLANASDDQEPQFRADGISDNLINALPASCSAASLAHSVPRRETRRIAWNPHRRRVSANASGWRQILALTWAGAVAMVLPAGPLDLVVRDCRKTQG